MKKKQRTKTQNHKSMCVIYINTMGKHALSFEMFLHLREAVNKDTNSVS